MHPIFSKGLHHSGGIKVLYSSVQNHCVSALTELVQGVDLRTWQVCSGSPRLYSATPLRHFVVVVVFRANLAIVKELGDRGAQGRACGNLGNTHYLLGNFELAIMFHEEVFICSYLVTIYRPCRIKSVSLLPQICLTQ